PSQTCSPLLMSLPPLRLLVIQDSLERLQALLQPLRERPKVLEHALVASRDLPRLLPPRDEVQHDEQRRRDGDEDDQRNADVFAQACCLRKRRCRTGCRPPSS